MVRDPCDEAVGQAVHHQPAGAIPAHIPGYEGGPLIHRPELLDEPLFFLSNLYGCVHSEEAEEALFGDAYDAAEQFHSELMASAQWPSFSLPLPRSHRLCIVYRTILEDLGVDYLLHHPDGELAETLASDGGHFTGPGLSWRELEAAASSGLLGGATADPHARLLLLFPALGDLDVDHTAVQRVARALTSRTHIRDPERAAALLMDGQGPAGPARWSTADNGVRTCDGPHAHRSNGALPRHRIARISAAFNEA
jgi:hypothetical protein